MERKPELTKHQWELLWSLLYNVNTNNAYLDRKTGLIVLDPEREDGVHVLDPLSVEQIRELSLIEREIWMVIGKEDEGL